MQIKIISDKFKVSAKLKLHIEGRVELALGRFSNRINTVTIECSNGVYKKGVAQNCCGIELKLDKRVKVKASHADVFAAVNQAVDNAVHSLARTFEHEQRLQGTMPTPTKGVAR